MQRSSSLFRALPLFVAVLAVASCADAPNPTEVGDDPVLTVEPLAAKVAGGANIVDVANATLEAQGSGYRIEYAEYYTDPASGQMGNVIFANNRGNKQLSLDFIPDDPRRGGVDGDPNTIDVLVDFFEGFTSSGLGPVQTTEAIARSTATWDAETCSELGLSVFPVGVDLGLVQWAFGFGGGAVATDVMHAGWLPGAFFDMVAPGGSGFILGVTFTLVWAFGDLDENGRPDLAAREIYYNDAFSWADDGATNIDVETVALHEGGHGLSQAHFGKIFGTVANGKLHFAPRAVMNAAYTGPQLALTGTDNGGHCSIWANWPNN